MGSNPRHLWSNLDYWDQVPVCKFDFKMALIPLHSGCTEPPKRLKVKRPCKPSSKRFVSCRMAMNMSFQLYSISSSKGGVKLPPEVAIFMNEDKDATSKRLWPIALWLRRATEKAQGKNCRVSLHQREFVSRRTAMNTQSFMYATIASDAIQSPLIPTERPTERPTELLQPI